MRLLSLAVILLLEFVAVVPAVAGTIGFQINSTVQTGGGVRLELAVKHNGDEGAADLVPMVVLGDRRVKGERLSRLGPGNSHTWKIDVLDKDLPAGSYVMMTHLEYVDANAYPFEVIAASPFNIAAKPRPKVTGSFRVPAIEGRGSADAMIKLQIPDGRAEEYDVTLAIPSGLKTQKRTFTVKPDVQRRIDIPVRIQNRNLLVGTGVDVFALVTGKGETPPQTDMVRGIARIAKAKDPVTVDLLRKITMALFLALLLLELLRWGGSRK